MLCIRNTVVVKQSFLEVGGESSTSFRKFHVGTYSPFSSKQVFQRHGALARLLHSKSYQGYHYLLISRQVLFATSLQFMFLTQCTCV